MKMVKSLLLGTAAGLVAVAGAQAADMPVKAKPVLFVKICSLYGDGFYYIPGTDTCLKLGGYLRVQAEAHMGGGGVPLGSGGAEAAQARQTRDLTNDINYRSRAALSWDVRQQTEYGTLRNYMRIGVNVTTPADTEGGAVFWDRAFIQFAGFTVGKTQSFFDLSTYGGAYSYHNVRVSGDTGAAGLTVWAYTAQFGNGFSATLSAEAPQGHNRAAVVDVSQSGFFNVNGATLQDNAFGQNTGGNGFRLPDVIANLRVDQAWGFIGVSGAVHESGGAYYGSNTASVVGGFDVGGVANGHPHDRLGWAVAAGGKWNIPGGHAAGANFCYAEGASGYCTNIGNGNQMYDASTSVSVGWLTDGVFRFGGQIEQTRVWSALAYFEYVWSPRWKTSFFGGYVNVDYNGAATEIINGGMDATGRAVCNVAASGGSIAISARAGNDCNPDHSFWEAGFRHQWNPVQQLDIGLEILYTNFNSAFKGPVVYNANGSRPIVPFADDQNVWSAMFRWQRNFYP